MIINIADRIKQLREQMNMTQTDLARKLHITRSAVNSWEMSLSAPSISNVIELAKIFNVTVDYLLTLTDKVTVDITELTWEEQKAVLNMVNCLKNK